MIKKYHSISQFLAPEPPAGQISGQCGVCGLISDDQFDRNEILDTTGSNITVLFPFNTGTMCASCVFIWREPKKWHRAILALENKIFFPLISESEHSSAERPTWRDVLRALDINQPRAAILTTDPKKRVWPKGRMSAGENIWLYIHDPSRGISENRSLIISKLITAIDEVENILNLGFSKQAIETSLLIYLKQAKLIGYGKIVELENKLISLRDKSEFIPALIVAQATEQK